MNLDFLTELPAGTLVLENTADLGAPPAWLHEAPALALRFPKWTDGRAYSQARLLRSRLRYAGPLIATGDVLVDMLPLLQRCGFDAVQLRADQDLQAARRVLGHFDDHRSHYQADLISKLPHFSRDGGGPERRPELRA